MAITVDVTPAVPASLFNGESVDVVYSATGGVAPYTFSVSAGSLPANLVLDPSTGELSGVLSDVPGTFNWTVEATDSTLPIAQTGTLDSSLVINPGLTLNALPVDARVPIRRVEPGCEIGGRQMARLIFDAAQTNDVTTILRGSQQQPIGQIKSLIVSMNIQGLNVGSGNLENSTLTVESTLSNQLVSFGPPPEMVNSSGTALCDVWINAVVPFFVDNDAPVNIRYGGAGSACNVRLHFCNWEVPPVFFASIDNTSD